MATTPQYLKPLEAAKAYVALIGSIATALLAVFTADSTVGKVLIAIAVIATAVVTYRVPNADELDADPVEDAYEDQYLDRGNAFDGH